MGTKSTAAPKRAVFASPEEVEQAFYEALRLGDVMRVMHTWADDEETVCIHPGGERLTGTSAIQASWHELLNSGPLHIHAHNPVVITYGMTVIHILIEEVQANTPRGNRELLFYATNVYHKGRTGWHLVHHHSAPAPSDVLLSEMHDIPNLLH